MKEVDVVDGRYDVEEEKRGGEEMIALIYISQRLFTTGYSLARELRDWLGYRYRSCGMKEGIRGDLTSLCE